MKTWIKANRLSGDEDGQGLIYDEVTGRSIAVTYERKDADIIAGAPALLKELDNALTIMRFLWDGQEICRAELANRIDMAEEAIKKAKGR